MAVKPYVLAVPNFSNGRNQEVIDAAVAEVKSVADIHLISVEPEADFNRTVVTLFGPPMAVKEALIKLGKKTTELIDMSTQSGSHPRIGAQDTLPIFPFKNISLEETKALAEEIGAAFHEATGVPVYFAGLNARTPDRASFAYIRKGQYEGLRQLLVESKDNPARADEYANRKPDLSKDGLLSNRSGATIVSCEENGLTAFNVFLNTENLALAKEIAKAVRGPSGGFSTVRAVGIKFPEHEGVVISMNLFNCIETPIPRVYDFCRREAERHGVLVTGSELVGPIKLEAVMAGFAHSLGLEKLEESQILETHLMRLAD